MSACTCLVLWTSETATEKERERESGASLHFLQHVTKMSHRGILNTHRSHFNAHTKNAQPFQPDSATPHTHTVHSSQVDTTQLVVVCVCGCGGARPADSRNESVVCVDKHDDDNSSYSGALIITMALLIGTKAFDVLDGRWRQPVDVGGRTAVAPDDVPLVGQTLISTKHAVKTECFLNI